jgi:D-alanyl-D-alanine carboxypeptidase
MTNTDYHDPAGLDVTGYSTAYDQTLVTKYALKNPIFAEIVKTKEEDVTDVTGKIKYQLRNSNRLVREWNYSGAIGVKTGYMPEASHTLIGAVRRDGHTLISVVLYTLADTVSASAEESKKLFDWGFKYTRWGDEATEEATSEPGIISSGNDSNVE